jgi:MFS family permease
MTTTARGVRSTGFGLVVPPVVALVLSPLIFRLASGEWRLVVLALAIPLGLFPVIVLALSLATFKARLSLSILRRRRQFAVGSWCYGFGILAASGLGYAGFLVAALLVLVGTVSFARMIVEPLPRYSTATTVISLLICICLLVASLRVDESEPDGYLALACCVLLLAALCRISVVSHRTSRKAG